MLAGFIVFAVNFWRKHHKSEMDNANVRAAIADKLSTEHRRLKKQTDRMAGILNNNGNEYD